MTRPVKISQGSEGKQGQQIGSKQRHTEDIGEVYKGAGFPSNSGSNQQTQPLQTIQPCYLLAARGHIGVGMGESLFVWHHLACGPRVQVPGTISDEV